MPPHPFEHLSVRQLRAGTVAAAVAWALLTVVLAAAVAPAEITALGALLEARDPAAARTVLDGFDASLVASLAFMLGFDFLYDLVHNNAVALFAVWGAARRATVLAAALGRATAWVLWLDTLLNVVENLAFLHVLRTRSPEPLLPVVTAIFEVRSATLVLGSLVGLGLHLSAWRAAGRR